MTEPLGIALCGFGKIARDQHLPQIASRRDVVLRAVASPEGGPDGVPWFSDVDGLLADGPPVEAIVFCEPPQFRFENACKAIVAGKAVFLEKPPAATLAQAEALDRMARARGVTVFAAWHSRYAPGVAEARERLKGSKVLRARIDWLEDVRLWHPGQDWLWEPGAFGVFDPGINALSILTYILAGPLVVRSAELEFPENRGAPIAARARLETLYGAPIDIVFDWRQSGPQIWAMAIETEQGAFSLPPSPNLGDEYRGLYDRFIDLVSCGGSEVDLAPLALTLDALRIGRRLMTAAFFD